MTPLKLGLCLHYATSSGDSPWIESGAPVVADTMRELARDGLLVEYAGKPRFRPTRKLMAFAEMLQRTPLPEPAFVDPRDGSRAGQY